MADDPADEILQGGDGVFHTYLQLAGLFHPHVSGQYQGKDHDNGHDDPGDHGGFCHFYPAEYRDGKGSRHIQLLHQEF